MSSLNIFPFPTPIPQKVTEIQITETVANQSIYLEWVRTSVILFGFGITIYVFESQKKWPALVIFGLAFLFLIEGYLSYTQNRNYLERLKEEPAQDWIPVNFWIVFLTLLITLIILWKTTPANMPSVLL